MGLERLLFAPNPLLLGYETRGEYDEMVNKSDSRLYVSTFLVKFEARINILFIVKVRIFRLIE